MNTNLPRLDARLMAAVGFVREGSFLADVGTDHAYLPIYLCLTGKIRGAVASDINRGPIERAQKNILAAGLGDRIAAVCTDGLCGLEAYAPEDILIFGMGGDLVVRILDGAPFLRAPGKRLILQPMTHADTVRRYLAENGWRLVGETLARADRIYQILCAEYDGRPYFLTDPEVLLGPCNLSGGGTLFREFTERQLRILKTRQEGKRRSRLPDSDKADSRETRLIGELERILARTSDEVADKGPV